MPLTVDAATGSGCFKCATGSRTTAWALLTDTCQSMQTQTTTVSVKSCKPREKGKGGREGGRRSDTPHDYEGVEPPSWTTMLARALEPLLLLLPPAATGCQGPLQNATTPCSQGPRSARLRGFTTRKPRMRRLNHPSITDLNKTWDHTCGLPQPSSVRFQRGRQEEQGGVARTRQIRGMDLQVQAPQLQQQQKHATQHTREQPGRRLSTLEVKHATGAGQMGIHQDLGSTWGRWEGVATKRRLRSCTPFGSAASSGCRQWRRHRSQARHDGRQGHWTIL